jgi:hypothetical protein
MLVDLRQVSDPEYRAELERSGVKPSPVNQALLGSPGVDGEILKPDIKPRRAPTKPQVVRASPLAASVKLVGRASVARASAPDQQLGQSATTSGNGVALGVAAGLALTSAALLGFSWLSEQRDE